MDDILPARCLLTGLHISMGLAAGVSLVTLLVQWTQSLDCLPPVIDVYGDPVSVTNVLSGACDIMTYGTGIICGLNFLQALFINCCWRSLGCAFTQQMLTALTCLFCSCCGAALTIDFLLWCNLLNSSLQLHGLFYDSCSETAEKYDSHHFSSNMTAYYRKLEIQQACHWAIVPLGFITIVVYTFVMCRFTLSNPDGPSRPVGHYYLLRSEELSPLIPSDSMQVSSHAPIRSISCASRDVPFGDVPTDRPVSALGASSPLLSAGTASNYAA